MNELIIGREPVERQLYTDKMKIGGLLQYANRHPRKIYEL